MLKEKTGMENLKNLPLYDNDLVASENNYEDEDEDEYEEKVEKGDTSKSLNNFRTDITKIVNEVFEIKHTIYSGTNRNKKVTSN